MTRCNTFLAHVNDPDGIEYNFKCLKVKNHNGRHEFIYWENGINLQCTWNLEKEETKYKCDKIMFIDTIPYSCEEHTEDHTKHWHYNSVRDQKYTW